MKMDISRLPQELLLTIALLGVCFFGYKFWEHRIRADEEMKTSLRLHKVWEARLRVAEDKALKELIEYRNENAKSYAKLAARADQLARELRQRPTRAQLEAAQQAHPLTAAACPVCTGERLAREDAEFLAREAAAGHAQQSDLQFATSSYETCRRTLKEVTEGKKP
jgi:excinuclease UvrABC ATPase subunit